MDTEVVALLDELERRVSEGHSFWFGHVSLNRKGAKQLVEAIGNRLDIAREASSGELPAGLARTLIVQGFAELDFLVRHGGGGGAVYQIFVLDVRRKRILAAIEMLRQGLELHDREQSARGFGAPPIPETGPAVAPVSGPPLARHRLRGAFRAAGWVVVAFLAFQAVAGLAYGAADVRIVGGAAGVTALLIAGALLMTRPKKRKKVAVSAFDRL